MLLLQRYVGFEDGLPFFVTHQLAWNGFVHVYENRQQAEPRTGDALATEYLPHIHRSSFPYERHRC